MHGGPERPCHYASLTTSVYKVSENSSTNDPDSSVETHFDASSNSDFSPSTSENVRKRLQSSKAPGRLDIFGVLKNAIEISQTRLPTRRAGTKITSQYHLVGEKRKKKIHRIPDVVIETPQHPAVALELASNVRSLGGTRLARSGDERSSRSQMLVANNKRYLTGN
ncbi:13871_t:CDS:2 [Gigaspora margarita]|uniref:13871_t:CDS:1 n=1 Tax=Gigaspora margarita TaxID=4874 RepID=A0ABN7UBH4_GIGMA|nr:13871_t:CDS:2 [Gigaspora margarita]